jgi:hypothetical protein
MRLTSTPPRFEADGLDVEVSFDRVVEPAKIVASISRGVRDVNALTNDVFFSRHPELPRVPLRRGQTQLAAEWLDIRDRLVRPALTRAGGSGVGVAVDASKLDVPLGTLTCTVPGRKPFSYRFTADDLVTTARFLIGEAGGVDNAENRGTLWAMLNRYAFFRDAVSNPGAGAYGRASRRPPQSLPGHRPVESSCSSSLQRAEILAASRGGREEGRGAGSPRSGQHTRAG